MKISNTHHQTRTGLIKKNPNKLWYHGSNTKIDKFIFQPNSDGNDEHGAGTYFVNDVNIAKGYGRYVYVINIIGGRELKTSESANIDEVKHLINISPDKEIALSNYAENQEMALKSFIENNDMSNKKEAFDSVWIEFYRNDNTLFLKNLVSLGYDYNIVQKTNKIKFLIIFNPEIIRIVNILENNTR